MLLRNFYNIMALAFMSIDSTDTETFGDGHLNIHPFHALKNDLYSVTKDGKQHFGKVFNPTGTVESFTFVSQDTAAYVFGTGNTAVSYNDYRLSGSIANISAANFTTISTEYINGVWKIKKGMTISNNSADEITVKEIGIIIPGGYIGSTRYGVLAYREVLDEPFTLAAGETVSYTHNFEFTMPAIE